MKQIIIIFTMVSLLTSVNAQSKNTTIATDIMTIQGASTKSPLLGQSIVSFEGAVTAIVRKKLAQDLATGFFIQDVVGDGNVKTSDGIFVAAKLTEITQANLVIGQVVNITGQVKEINHQTVIFATNIVATKRHHKIVPTALYALTSDSDFSQTLERHEGMLVKFNPKSKMLITRTFSYQPPDRRNNMVISHLSVNRQPNQLFLPGSAQASALRLDNQQRSVVIESFVKAPRGQIPWYPGFGTADSNGENSNYLRVGDQINDLTGVLGFASHKFRLYVTKPVTNANFSHNNRRTTAPEIIRGNLSVATFNVLNYFNSPFGGNANPMGKSRGATSITEFILQGAKISQAIIALDADIVGLMEVENNGDTQGSAVFDLLTTINNQLIPSKRYVVATTQQKLSPESSSITNKIIYRPSLVSLSKLISIPMPQQHAPRVGKESGHNFMRNALTATFNIDGHQYPLTVSVNHFKSKGSTCWEDVGLQSYKDPDLQGSCEHFRVSAAYYLGQQLAKIPGHTLIIGDLNSYAKEDPIRVLTGLKSGHSVQAARNTFVTKNGDSMTELHLDNGATISDSFDYINTVALKHPQAFGYSFAGQVGTLDYILASPSLTTLMVDVTEWNINSPESPLLEYAKKYTGKMNKFNDVYRSSDHDPVIISFKF